MLLRLPHSLHYPITVTELLKQPDDYVARFAPLFSYTYTTTVTEGNELGEVKEVEKSFPSCFESGVEGTLKSWKLKKGDVIEKPDVDVAEIKEPCAHEVQFGGMCANCGKDMTQFSYNTETLDATRATVKMVHDNSALTVSQDEAKRIEEEAKRRLLASKKLSLVVDLDQTIIHATVDPTVLEWQQDASNPNHEAVKDVRSFQLMDDGPGARGCSYYIKLRPGLIEFLEDVSKTYELHIYTMGTRAYAQNIANLIDPDRKIFGDRILSRDESGSLTAKDLRRLFPVDTKMVVIIDDRGDVWNWSHNLIRVPPFDFFIGIGDINSSFLPKRQPLQLKPRPPPQESNDDVTTTESRVKLNGDDEDDSALEQLVTMAGEDPSLLQEQTSQQSEALAAQLQERPLLQKQKQLDMADEAAEVVETPSGPDNGEEHQGDIPPHDSTKHRHHLLEDNDNELTYLEARLRAVHRAFFEEYERKLAGAQGGRVAALRGEKKLPVSDAKQIDLKLVPDIKAVMPQLKQRVFSGLIFVFSGVVPLGLDVQTADVSLWAKSFGAQISNRVSKKTTHLVAARSRTAKVRQAARVPRIKIVTTQWMFDCIARWERLDERPYLIAIHPDDNAQSFETVTTSSPTKEGGFFEEEGVILSSTEESDVTTEEDEISTKIDLHVDTDDLDESLIPTESIDDGSPIGGTKEDWSAINDELAEFLGEDATDSDNESIASSLSFRDKKRKRDVTEPGEESDSASESGPEALHRKKRSMDRPTHLQEVKTAGEEEDTDAYMAGVDTNHSKDVHAKPDTDTDEEDNFEDELEAELEKELSRSEDSNPNDGG